MNYWDKQKQLKEVYDRATNDSGVSWHEEYLKEKAKRFEVEEKYERLTRKIKENAIKEVNEREVKDIDEDGVEFEYFETYDYWGNYTATKDGAQGSVKEKLWLVDDEWKAEARKLTKSNLMNALSHKKETEAEFGKLVQERLDDDEEPIKVDFGAGPREVQHIMKRRDYEKDI